MTDTNTILAGAAAPPPAGAPPGTEGAGLPVRTKHNFCFTDARTTYAKAVLSDHKYHVAKHTSNMTMGATLADVVAQLLKHPVFHPGTDEKILSAEALKSAFNKWMKDIAAKKTQVRPRFLTPHPTHSRPTPPYLALPHPSSMCS